MRRNAIYLDYSATTPVDPLVLKAMLPYLKKEYGNPSSVHSLGQLARAAIEQARERVAAFLHASASEVVFTSGATEANNLSIQGVIRQAIKPHVVTSSIEHESVLAPIQELEKERIIEATYIQPSKDGIVEPKEVARAIRKNTVLVSIQYANSEIGTVQPIAEIGKLLGSHKVLFHTDAVQAALYLGCNVEKLGVDLLTLSSHKIYGPKGAGVLYVKKGVDLRPLCFGGGQEQDIRPGTENVAVIVGTGQAFQNLQSPRLQVTNIKIRQLRDKLQKDILKRIPDTALTGSQTNRLPHNIHLQIAGIEGKDAVVLLDQKGIAVSTGSACSERSQEPSHVLRALGFPEKGALSALRITLGKYTTAEETRKAVKALLKVVEHLRKTN